MITLKGDKVKLQDLYFERAKRKAGVDENLFTVIKTDGAILTLISSNGKRFNIFDNHIDIVEPQRVRAKFGYTFRNLFDCSENNILSNIYNRLCHCNVRNIEKNYFDINFNPDKKVLDVTFMHLSKARRINDGYYESKSRDISKPIKLINEILRANNKQLLSKEEELEVLNLVTIKDFYDFQIVSGDDIAKYYCEDYYADGGGSLNKSCMRYFGVDTGVFDIYKDNAKMIIMKDKEKDIIYGRAIIWNIENSKTEEKITFMDRIYTQKEIYEILFKEYAEKNNMAYLNVQQRGECGAKYKGEDIDLTDYRLKLKKDIYKYSMFPYVDTWCNVPMIFSNILECECGNYGDIDLTNTDGSADVQYYTNDVIRWYEYIILNKLPISRWEEGGDDAVVYELDDAKYILLHELTRNSEEYMYAFEDGHIVKKDRCYDEEEWDDWED